MTIEFVSIDFETANQVRSSICAVGLTKVNEGKIVDKFYSLINPEDYFDPYNIEIHGITESMVKNAPIYPNVRHQIIDFIGDLPVVAHYAPFDTGAIRDANLKYNLEHFELNYFCSYALSRSLLQLVSYKLNYVAEKFNLKFQHHDALEDAETCAKITLELSKIANAESVIELIEKAGYKKLGYMNKKDWSGFRKPKNKQYIDILKQLNYPNIEALDPDNEFFGKYVVFTGTLSSMPRKVAMQNIVNVGGIPQKTINKDTNFLITGEQDITKLNGHKKSSKLRKAEELVTKGQDIQIIGEIDFLKMVN